VADSKLIIGAAVTMTTLEIYLEKLCKTSSGTCITLENLGNNILMIYIFKFKRYSTLNVERYSMLNVERYSTLNVERYSTLNVERYPTLNVERYSTLNVERYSMPH
jgi:hypothetical protein